MAEQYVYAVTRIHANEQGLLSQQDLQQLVAAKNAAEVFRLLSDKGWGGPSVPAGDTQALLEAETDKVWALIEELTGGVASFNVFKYANDFHNLKAAIKLEYSAEDQGDTSRYFIKYGTVDRDLIIKAAREHNFEALPDDLAEAGRKAYEVLSHSGSGQACDMVIDQAALVAISKAGEAGTSELLRRYARLTVDSANIKAAVRSALMKKSEDFIRRAVAPAGSLDIKALVGAAAADAISEGEGTEAIYAYLQNTEYVGAVGALKESLAAFERWCDNQMIELIRPQRYNYFSLEPMAAFILARENEIRMVRLILSAKQNGLGEEVLRERLRETYV